MGFELTCFICWTFLASNVWGFGICHAPKSVVLRMEIVRYDTFDGQLMVRT